MQGRQGCKVGSDARRLFLSIESRQSTKRFSRKTMEIAMSASSHSTRWLDEFFAWYYRCNPVSATFIGEHAYDCLLPEYSTTAIAGAVAAIDTLLQRYAELPAEPLTLAERHDAEVAVAALEIQRWELGAAQFHSGNPCFYTGEAVFGVISLFLREYAPIAERAAAAVARMHAIPAFLAQAQANLRAAPAAWVERARRECIGALALLNAGIDRISAEHVLPRAELRVAGAEAAQAFRVFDQFLANDITLLDGGYACGSAALDLQIRKAHFLDQSAADIAAYARMVIAECRAYLEAGTAAFGAATWQEALAGLAELHPTPDDYYARYGELWDACRALVIERDALTWPDYPIRYVPQPRWAREAAPYLYFLFYRAPAAFDALPIVDYLVTPIEPSLPADEQQRRLRATNDSVIKLNHVVHHGAVGHHVQNWYAYRAASRIGRIAAVDCASRIALPCGGTMAEGWACYATDLMAELGFLTPLEQYSQHQSRMRMATRALVDVELHSGRISLAEAADVYVREAGMAPAVAHAEAVKNSMLPGAALIYLIGTDQIHALRRTLAIHQGERFNLRAFHDRFLSFGSLPVALIARAMLEEAGV
jgi:hypothetical protein